MALRSYSLPLTPVVRVELLCLQEIVTYLHVTCRYLSAYSLLSILNYCFSGLLSVCLSIVREQ